MEDIFIHAPFDREIKFYESICEGDLEKVKFFSTSLCSEGYGILSKDPLRNLKYHMIISVAMITRFCINGGMPSEEAYNLTSFTKKMNSIKTRNIYSKQIVKAINYINSHITEKIMIQEVADFLSLSVSYLSRLFKSEVGLNISEYIIKQKIKAAEGMLRSSSQSSTEISYILHFSSQSYFTKVFKKYTGMTPKEYQKLYKFL